MRTKHMVSMASLALGFGLAISSPFAAADETIPGFFDCPFACALEYQACVEENGLRMGCGRAYRACIASC